MVRNMIIVALSYLHRNLLSLALSLFYMKSSPRLKSIETHPDLPVGEEEPCGTDLKYWEPLLIQTVPGVQLAVKVHGPKHLLEVVEDKEATVVVVGLFEELRSHNEDLVKVCLLLHLSLPLQFKVGHNQSQRISAGIPCCPEEQWKSHCLQLHQALQRQSYIIYNRPGYIRILKTYKGVDLGAGEDASHRPVLVVLG